MKSKLMKLFEKCAVLATSIALLFGITVTVNNVNADNDNHADITQQTVTQRNYQGENNWYYLTGDFSENQLYRMYYNTAYGWWQGYGHLGCSIAGTVNTAYPTNADVMLAYVIPEFGSVSLSGRTILVGIEENENKAIDVKIVHRSADGTDVELYGASVSDYSAEGVAFESKTFDVKAGDVIFFVAETNTDLDVWEGITFDSTIELTKKAGKSDESKNALSATAMPLTGAHTVAVTNGYVDPNEILTESMKLKQGENDRQKYAYRGTNGGYALFDYDESALATGMPYRLSGMNFDSCSTGINAFRVFYANNTWTGASGMIYYMPTNGFASVIGKAVVGGTCDIVKVSSALEATVLKTLSAGEYDFSTIDEINHISVSEGDFVGIFFDGGAWTVSSFAGAFDFYAEAAVASETVVAPTGVELTGDCIVDGTITLVEGESATVTATVLPSYATDAGFDWSILDETVATVENGVITAVKAGETVITVVANGNAEAKQTIEIIVTEKINEDDNNDNNNGNNNNNDNNNNTPKDDNVTDNDKSGGCSSYLGTTGVLAIVPLLGFVTLKRKRK